MKLGQWLKANGDAVKTTAAVLQSIVVIGGILSVCGALTRLPRGAQFAADAAANGKGPVAPFPTLGREYESDPT